jgi:hypothetical protein
LIFPRQEIKKCGIFSNRVVVFCSGVTNAGEEEEEDRTTSCSKARASPSSRYRFERYEKEERSWLEIKKQK